ncbi:hypothetical protein F2P81_007925 [Scophthalmus maximus]|uniref:Uncharacterized protein n=1 Tax=Scophthalmus maximus TaxID=52904 RepID=A0A6A4T6T8_SCOMX|nr:hypothetical protein F2P81_007925 [Scophthalmus maximus]
MAHSSHRFKICRSLCWSRTERRNKEESDWLKHDLDWIDEHDRQQDIVLILPTDALGTNGLIPSCNDVGCHHEFYLRRKKTDLELRLTAVTKSESRFRFRQLGANLQLQGSQTLFCLSAYPDST